MSRFTIAPALTETGAYGYFIASSTTQALSVEVLEKLNVAVDGVTPEFGEIGAGIRRVGRRSGSTFASVDFERVSGGLAWMSRGSNLDVGAAVELALGFLNYNGSGFGVQLDAYSFAPMDLAGADTLFVVTVGYVYSPFSGLRRPTLVRGAPATAPHPAEHPCGDAGAYRDALVAHRKDAVQECNKGFTPQCQRARDIVNLLNEKLSECLQGQDVGPPTEFDDAPPR